MPSCRRVCYSAGEPNITLVFEIKVEKFKNLIMEKLKVTLELDMYAYLNSVRFCEKFSDVLIMINY
jgi:hypothetical protein